MRVKEQFGHSHGDKNMNRICVIGANGFLGRKFIDHNLGKWEIIALDIDNSAIPEKVPFYSLDLRKREQISEKLGTLNPDYVLLAAAMTDVDGCERNPELCFKINTQGPRFVAEECHRIGARLFFISTDFVYDGKSCRPYIEEDEPNPISVYGQSKLEAERQILKINCDTIVCRTSVLYGWQFPGQSVNFASWLFSKLSSHDEIKIVTTQYNTPTYSDDLACFLGNLTNNFSGFSVYHTVGSSCISRFEFAMELAKKFGLSTDLIQPVKKFSQEAERPKFGCLNNEKASKQFNFHFKTLAEGLEKMTQTIPRM